MPKAKKTPGMATLPQYPYDMPDESVSLYELILEQLENYRNCMIGSSHFYIRADEKCHCLCRLVHGGGRIFFHEQVDHRNHGISDEDLKDSVRRDSGSFTLPGYYIISPLVEQKLRVLYDV